MFLCNEQIYPYSYLYQDCYIFSWFLYSQSPRTNKKLTVSYENQASLKTMLLNLTWLIPGLPIIASVIVLGLFLSFNKTMNRLTKPVSYFLICSISFSEIINFILLKNDISGNDILFGGNVELVVDRAALIFSESIGFIFLLIMLFSVLKLKRKSGYVRYFVVLGLLSGCVYLFSLSGGLFHNFYDPLLSSLDKAGVSFQRDYLIR